LPLVLILVWSLTNVWPWPNLLPERLSLRAFTQVYTSGANFLSALFLTVTIGIAVSLLTVFAATLAARALVLHVFRGREVFRFATILPFLVPQTVFAMGIQVLFFKLGLANTVSGVIIAHCVVALPYAATIMVDVTQAAGTHLEEQARVMGASSFNMARFVTLPVLLPGILSAASLSYIISIGNYFVTLLIGGGNVSTVMTIMFPFLASEDRAIAGVYVVSFLAVTLLVFLAFEMILGRLGVRERKSLFGG
jgi:putative spermidine/putrescine transport system permease protein